MKYIFICLSMLCLNLTAQQSISTIRGTCVDTDSKTPLIGVNISITQLDQDYGTSSDIDGSFEFRDVPIGRYSVSLTYIGYKPIAFDNILLGSGKELVLEFEMEEEVTNLNAVVVKANKDKSRPLNEMALVSARSFSVEETSRYAGSLQDPARMALNYAGVSGSGGSGDLFNEIIVRGNSPAGVTWFLEGIEIANPNHFGGLGNSGGGISMLSANTLSNSDFYTGAFPSQYGNATAGVFDLRLRKGNDEKREYTLGVGILGVDASLEGPIGQKGASYLVNYRYSTLSVLQLIGLNPAGDVIPKYQDLSFNIVGPRSKIGRFSAFGLFGKNSDEVTVEADSSEWRFSGDEYGFQEEQFTAIAGIKHQYLYGKKGYITTIASISSVEYDYRDYFLDARENYREIEDERGNFLTQSLRFSTLLNHKISARHTLRLGAVYSHQYFDYLLEEIIDDQWNTYLNSDGTMGRLQAYAQWKAKLSEKWLMTAGLHYTRLNLAGQDAIEPRVAFSYNVDAKNRLSLAAGLHSKAEHPTYYFLEENPLSEEASQPNKNLELIKSAHFVLGYERKLSEQLNLKTEVYYQYLYDVPVPDRPGSQESILNTQDVFDIFDAGRGINEGNGRNIGIDLTLERYFADRYYFMLTGSLYNSEYRSLDNEWYNTRYNGNYSLNILGGKEYKVGKRKSNILGVNLKGRLNGGNRIRPIDFDASREAGFTIRSGDPFSGQVPDYWRIDLSLSLRINKTKRTNTILLDIQNVTNRLNVFQEFYSTRTGGVVTDDHSGIIPNLTYRVQF